MDWSSLPIDTIIWLGLIVTLFIGFLIYVLCLNSENLMTQRRLVEYFPSLISTLGVIGTFWGITKGLINFNTTDLDSSIPLLLDGLKTAFYTSLAGMACSMLLSVVIHGKYAQKDSGISDINQATDAITKAITAIIIPISKTHTILQELKEQDTARLTFYQIVTDRLTTFDNLKEAIIKQATSVNTITKHTQEISERSNHLGKILDIISCRSGIENEISEKIGRLKEILHAEVIEIEDSMAKTNELLENKFNEFTELLKKSNTEALVEVMQNVTKEFQKQMNALINKLIQENFDQLNKSVEKLNLWQQENKDMIISLTRQYKDMSDNFEATSSSLTRVKEDTTILVSEGGKLHQLVDALNKVIVDDKRFIEVTKELHETAYLSKSNMESFNESTQKLNEWVRKQRNFVDGVQLLITKLEELNKIRDYGEQFWQGTKDKMEEGVGIITKGSLTLNTQLTSLDRQFYGRLSATLAELDNCITKMVEQIDKRK